MKYIKRYKTQNDYINNFVDLINLGTYISFVDDNDK
jgi:hypothetical protein